MTQLSFIATVLNRPWQIGLLTVLVFVVCMAGLGGLQSSNDYRAYLDDDYPSIVELAEVESLFQENKSASLILIPKGGNVFTATTIKALRELTKAAWQIPHVIRVDSLSNFQHTRAIGDDLIVDALVPDEAVLDDDFLKRISDISLREPALRTYLISPKADIAIVNLTFDIDADGILSAQERDAVAEGILSVLNDFELRYPSIDLRGSGVFFADYYSDQYLKKINNLLAPAMLLLMVVILALFLRSIGGVIAASIIVIASGVITMGIFGWIGLLLEAVAALGPIVIMTLAVADSIHIIIGTQNAMGQGFAKREAIRESLRVNFTPVLLTSVTTVLGVITYTFTDFPSLRKLGFIVALGVSVAFILSVTLLPILLNLLPLRANKPSSVSNRFFKGVAELVINHHRMVASSAIILSVVLSLFVLKTSINESFSEMFKEHTEIAKSIKIIDTRMAGILRMDVAVFNNKNQAKGETSLTDPAHLKMLENFSDWALSQDNVTHVNSITDTYKRLNRSMHGDVEEWYRLPDSQAMAAQYLLLYELSLPYGLDLANQISLDKSATLVSLSAKNVVSANVVKLRDDIKQWFAINAPSVRAAPTGVVTVISEASYRHMIPNMGQGAIIAVLMVSLVLFIALRSWLLGFFGMLANLIPIAIGYGIWGLAGNTVGFIVISVAGICLGMVVDFAVHFIDKFRVGLKTLGSAPLAVHYAYETVGKPLVVTATVLMAGFSVIAFTELNSMAGLGLMTPLIIGLALIFDLIALPAMLVWVYGTEQRQVKSTV